MENRIQKFLSEIEFEKVYKQILALHDKKISDIMKKTEFEKQKNNFEILKRKLEPFLNRNEDELTKDEKKQLRKLLTEGEMIRKTIRITTDKLMQLGTDN